MSAPLISARRAAIACLALVAALAATPLEPARAQPAGEIELSLLDQPVWHEPDDPLGLRLRITNHSSLTLDGFGILIRVFNRAHTRSDFEVNFEVDPTRLEASSHSIDFSGTQVPVGGSEVVELTSPISDLSSLATTNEDGIYPLTVTVTDEAGFSRLDDLTTQLIYLPSDVEKPLHIVPVWQLVDVPARSSRGFETTTDGSPGVQEAVQEGGWLRGVTDALGLPVAERLRMGLAPLPRLLEELDDMADGFVRVAGGSAEEVPPTAPVPSGASATLEGLRAVAGRPGVQTIPLPYSLPDLPSLIELEQTTAQLNATESVLDNVLGVTPGRAWLFPPSGRLDGSTLESLRASNAVASTFVSSDVIGIPATAEDTSCQEGFPGVTHTCPVVLTTPSGRARAYLLDEGLQERFGALVGAPRDRLALQRLFAETAMIWAELPGTSDRVVVLSAPPLWHPPPWIARLFVRTLARAPWLEPVTPREGLRLGIGAVSRDLVGQVTEPRSAPESEFDEEVEQIGDLIESFARMKPPVPMIERLRRDVLTAQSRLWWGDASRLERGTRFARDARTRVEEELAKITVRRQDVTLTSRTGDIPLVLLNRTSYPVSLRVALETFDRDINISDPEIERTFEPGATPLPLQVTARSSGIYRVRTTVESPDGFVVHETAISIRSTQFNEMALAITLGALGFLVLFYVVRRIRARHPTPAPDTQ